MKRWTLVSIGLFFFCFFSYAQQLKPLDGIRVTIYNIPEEITGDYFIQKDNNLQLPYIGEINTIGKDYEELKEEISLKYRSIYRNPELVVEPLFKINILGEVKNPGEYYITGVERVTDMIARAGGETLDADLSDIIITRNNQEITVDVENVLEDGDEEQDLTLVPGDRVYISKIWLGGAQNTSVVISAVTVVLATVVAILANN